MALEGRGALVALGVFAAAAAVLVSLWVQNRPPAPTTAPTPVPVPPPSRAPVLPTEPAPAEPSPSPPAAIYGSVYEVTIARPTTTATEDEGPPLDLRHVDPKDVSPPVLVHRVEPAYPEIARRARAEGQVWVEAVITARGEVVDPRVVRSTTSPLLGRRRSGPCVSGATVRPA